MEVIHERCCGLDVHKRTVVACVLTAEGRFSRSFGTMTDDLRELGDWLLHHAVTHVAMESTGVFWKPKLLKRCLNRSISGSVAQTLERLVNEFPLPQ